MDEETTLDHLPLEMIAQIFHQLDSVDLPIAAKVHPEWETIISRLIGFDVQIKAETISKNSVKLYDDLLQINMDDVARLGIRRCTVGENFSGHPEKYSLKYPFLLKNISFGGPIWPAYVQGLLVDKTPNNLCSLKILFNSLVIDMSGLLSQLRLPNLKKFKIKDTGIVVPDRKMKSVAIRNAVRNIQELLTVRFHKLEKFKFEMIQTATALSSEEEIGLTRGIFYFLGHNRGTLQKLKLRIFKKNRQVHDHELTALANAAGIGGRLQKVELHLIPDVGNTVLDSSLAFLRGQRFLQDVIISGDKVPFGNFSKTLTQGSFYNLTEIKMSKRFLPDYEWGPGYSLNCTVFQNCQRLRKLSCQITPKTRPEKIRINDADCIGVGFYPMIVNTEFLPLTLESITFESFAIPLNEIDTLCKMPQLKEAFLLGNWIGNSFGLTAEFLKTVLARRTIKEVMLGPFKSSPELLKGFSNGDLNDPTIVKLPRKSRFIRMILNENEYYECV